MTDKFLLRNASKAGSWYESNQKLLGKELLSYIENTESIIKSFELKYFKNLKAIICPHAGYAYSGPTSAYSYKRLSIQTKLSNIKTIIILGPSHYSYFKGCKVSQFNEIQTPFGNLEADKEVITTLSAMENFSKLTKEADEKEHSIEMQYPFIYYSTYKDSSYKPKIVSIMIGEIDDNISSISNTLLPYFEREDVVFIVSSDFCHWGKHFNYQPFNGKGKIYDYIEDLDNQGMDFIINKDYKGFSNYMDTTDNTICGRNPIKILMYMIENSKYKDNINGYKLMYNQSSKVESKNESSVSYSSISFELNNYIK